MNIWRSISLTGASAIAISLTPCQSEAQATLPLIGTVTDPSGGPVTGAMVSVVGIGSDITTSSGQFRIAIPSKLVGAQLTLRVQRAGWTIVDQRTLVIIVPQDPVQHPLRIVLKRITSKWSTNRRLAAAAPPGKVIGIMAGPPPVTSSSDSNETNQTSYQDDVLYFPDEDDFVLAAWQLQNKPDKLKLAANLSCHVGPDLRLSRCTVVSESYKGFGTLAAKFAERIMFRERDSQGRPWKGRTVRFPVSLWADGWAVADLQRSKAPPLPPPPMPAPVDGKSALPPAK